MSIKMSTIEVEATIKKVSEETEDVDRYGNGLTKHTLTLKMEDMSHLDFLRLCRARLLGHTISVQIQCLQFEFPDEPMLPDHIEARVYLPVTRGNTTQESLNEHN